MQLGEKVPHLVAAAALARERRRAGRVPCEIVGHVREHRFDVAFEYASYMR